MKMTKKYNNIIIKKKINLRQALSKLQENEIKMLCFVNKKNELVGAINDGDIRRAILKYQNLDLDLNKIINKRPITGNINLSDKDAYQIMKRKQIDYLPILKNRKIIEIKCLKNFELLKKNYNVSINVMAGGFGKRLKPYTNKLNKCLVLVTKKKRIIDYSLENVLKINFKNINFFLHYKKEQVKKYIRSKYKKFQSNFYYEKKPLGTIGGLSQLKINDDTDIFILINADVVCSIDFERLIDFHKSNKSDFTIVTSQKEIQLKYGLLENLNLNIDSIHEKPSLSFNINTGIYLFNPKLLKLIKKNQVMDAVSFIKLLKQNKKKIISYPIYENWFDLGTPEDLQQFKNFQKNL
jgi:dTDP-glucose pyrophosphorylase